MAQKEEEFYEACREGNLENVIILSLIQDSRFVNQIDVNWRNPNHNYWTGFHSSCREGRKEIVEYLISHPKINVNKESNSGKTPLYLACLKEKGEIVKILLKDERVSVNKEDALGVTPLYTACRWGKEEIVKILFASGREIDTTKKTIPGNESWNNKTAAEIARKDVLGSGKGEQIAKLVDEYAKNPMEIILRLRNEMSKYFLIVQIYSQQNHLQN